MVFSRFSLCAMVAGLLIVSLAVPSIALRVLGSQSQTCSPRTDPVTGISRVICVADEEVSPQQLKKRDVFAPMLSKPVIVGPTSYDPVRKVSSSARFVAQKTLPQRLCKSQRTPYAGLDRNEEGYVARVVQCLPAGSIIGQEGASFLPRSVQLSRWRQLRDPIPYRFKHNRELSDTR